jgi:predicted RNase H-like nuclease
MLLGRPPCPTIVAVDIPIGLPHAGPRACDAAARRLLGRPRASSVFSAPIRPALAASSRAEAARITQETDGRRVGAQAFGIYAKVRETDQYMSPSRQNVMREVHPEVSFRAWNNGIPIAAGKRTSEGLATRRALVEAHFGRAAFEQARSVAPRRQLADDDIVDAFAALWTAHRISEGTATTLPDEPPRDARGLRMEIVF